MQRESKDLLGERADTGPQRKVPIPLKMWVVTALVCMPSFLFGYVSASLNSCLVTGDGDSIDACFDNTDDESNNCPPGTVYNDIKLTNTMAQLATALMVLGSWMGCLMGSAPAEKYGRRLVCLWNNVLFIAGALLCASGEESLLYIGRFVAGLGVGIESVVVPVLLSEIASEETRGTITTMHQLFLTVGIFMASAVGYGLVMYVEHGWQYLQATIAVPAIIMTLGAPLIPESPKWLVQNGRQDEAATALKMVRGPETDVYAELADLIADSKANDNENEASWKEVFACRRPVVIGIGLMCMAALTGINTVIFYSTSIFSYAGFDQSILATLSVGAVNFFSTVLACYLVDILGRKTLLQVGTQIMTAALLLLSVILLTANDNVPVQGAIAVVAVLIFVFGFAIGLGAVSWVVMAEIMSTRLRSKAFGLFVSINWGFNLIIGMLTLSAIEGLGGTTSDMDDDEQDDANKRGVAYLYFIIAGICFASVLFIMKYIPETRGKTPESFLDPTAVPLLADLLSEDSSGSGPSDDNALPTSAMYDGRGTEKRRTGSGNRI